MENNKEKDYVPNQVISKENLKTYFENGDIPDEQDFWEWQDSYWHKNDPNDIIPAERVDLSGKSDKNATNLDGENVQNWRTKLNIENTDQDNIAIVHIFTLADIGAIGTDDEETLNQLITEFINSLNITIGEKEMHYFQLVDENDSEGNSGGDFIPLRGTGEGKPVTGDIVSYSNISCNDIIVGNVKIQDGFIVSENNNTKSSIYMVDGAYMRYTFENYGSGYIKTIYIPNESNNDYVFRVSDNNPFSRGISSDVDFTKNIQELDYVQKKYVDNFNSYSAEETRTGGTWINGKPIYRKVIIITNNAESGSIPDIDNLVSVDGYVKTSEFLKLSPFTSQKSSTRTYFQLNEMSPTNGYWEIEGNYEQTEIIEGYLIFEYTKTKD